MMSLARYAAARCRISSCCSNGGFRFSRSGPSTDYVTAGPAPPSCNQRFNVSLRPTIFAVLPGPMTGRRIRASRVTERRYERPHRAT